MNGLVSILNPGDRVLDPFAGSGSTGIACVCAGIDFVGIEMTQHFCDLARKRLADSVSPLFEAG
jgi:site-specific DNA-methyltransferase (adenine-specific)